MESFICTIVFFASNKNIIMHVLLSDVDHFQFTPELL